MILLIYSLCIYSLIIWIITIFYYAIHVELSLIYVLKLKKLRKYDNNNIDLTTQIKMNKYNNNNINNNGFDSTIFLEESNIVYGLEPTKSRTIEKVIS